MGEPDTCAGWNGPAQLRHRPNDGAHDQLPDRPAIAHPQAVALADSFPDSHPNAVDESVTEPDSNADADYYRARDAGSVGDGAGANLFGADAVLSARVGDRVGLT